MSALSIVAVQISDQPPPPSGSPALHVLPWDRPLPAQAAAWLARDWRGDTPLDLSNQLVIVPTRQSGRRLREALARHAAARGQAVFPPRVVLPDQLLADGEAPVSSRPAATPYEALFAWVDVLLALDLTECDDVFPVEPPARTFAWAARIARQFLDLQTTLAENGLRMADVPGAAGDPFPEAARWTQLAALERRYDAVLVRAGRRDPQAARIARARAGSPPAGVRRITIVATPDPLPLAITWLGRCARAIPVDVLVFGPKGEAPEAWFDPWGRPHTEAWTGRSLALADFEARVHLCPDPSVQAARIVNVLAGTSDPEGVIGIGVADADIAAPLRHALGRAGFTAFDPEGKKRRSEPLHHVLALLDGLTREPTFATAASVVRCPDVLTWLEMEARTGARDFSAARCLAGLDELHARHLPPTLEAACSSAAAFAQRFPEVPFALDRLVELQRLASTGTFEERSRAPLARVFSRRRFDLEREEDARTVESARMWMQVATGVAAAAERFDRREPLDGWDAALHAFGETVRFDARPAGAIELQGWLELLWEDAPQVLVAGLNDGRVPTAIVGDAFLPETLRERLGLKTNAGRLARDAYVLQAMVACRADGGRCDLFLGKTSAAGDPLRPSRLLLACDDALLPGRVAFLFRELEAERSSVPWRRAWRLRPGQPARAITHMPVTGFRAYLKCPFRFYLRHGLRMEPVDPHKAELDARDFGNLCHAAFEALGAEPGLRECTDAGVLREFLLAALESRARFVFGDEWPLPLVIQLESARQRLARAAEVQARLYADGWFIEQVELPLEFPVGPITVRAKIDRIDRHRSTGARRVLDYKTADKPVNPRTAHARKPKGGGPGTPAFDGAFFEIASEPMEWIDLQLPLYLRALAATLEGPVSCGYFNLPKAANETAVALWDDYSPEWQAAADQCAEAIANAVATGSFWPPAELDEREDDFAALFHHGTAESVAWETSGGSSR